MLTMSVGNPSVIVLAGPNGAGKTTCAPTLLRETLGVVEIPPDQIVIPEPERTPGDLSRG